MEDKQKITLQARAIALLEEHRYGLFTPEVMLARLGTCLSVRLANEEDVMNLSDELAATAVRLIPRLQRPLISTTDVVRS
jgi:hypothetical protein